MKKTISLVLAIIMLVSVLSLLCGCSGGKSNMSGEWVAEEYDSSIKDMYRYMPSEMELFSDGSGSAVIPFYHRESVSWTAEGGRLKMGNYNFEFVYDYKIKGGVLTLQYQDYSVSYTRK